MDGNKEDHILDAFKAIVEDDFTSQRQHIWADWKINNSRSLNLS